MTLDTRATRATRSINQAVTGASPVAMRTVVGRRRRSFGAGLAGALTVLFAAVALAATLPVFESTEAAHQTDVTVPAIEHGTGGPILHRSVTDSPEPYALFSGVAAPGAIVTAASEFGSADLVVGESGEWVLKVVFESPPPGVEFGIVLTVGDQVYTFGFTSLWDPSNVDITAHQAFGLSDDPHPFAKYYGTAPPGTVVTAVSEFGSADTTAGEEGQWELGIWFEGAPAGEGFPVTVTVGDEVFQFTFAWLQPGVGGDEIEVTVAQVGTSSEAKSPYTQFVGTAPQGTHVLATSAYGSADLEVGESGEFTLKVRFTNPPPGVKFPIIVKIDGDVYGEYHFTSYYEAPPSGEVTVHQHNTASESANPWVKFYGTAPKGTHIQIISPYGSWSWNTEAVEWNSGPKYFSPLPPAGQTFNITVKVNGETFGVYPFTSHFNGDQVIIEVVKTAAEGPEPYTRIEYWAPAGTTIQLISDYGSTSKTVAETGGGDLKLWFSPLPPAGVPFTVTIKVNGDVWETYQFTSYYEADDTPVVVNHAFNSCSEDPPFDDLWGTAPAGTQIKILSEFGWSEFIVGESGNWEKRQYFEGAPYGVPFTVTVKVSGEVHTTYQFTVNEPEV